MQQQAPRRRVRVSRSAWPPGTETLVRTLEPGTQSVGTVTVTVTTAP